MLKRSLTDLPPADRLLLIPLVKEYTEYSLSKGVDAFDYPHRKQYEAIKAATGEGWKIRIITAKHYRFDFSAYGVYNNSSSHTSIQKIFDEEGNDITTEEKKWLAETLDFDSAADMDGMVLSDPDDDIAEIWGSGVCVHNDSTYGSEDEGGTTHIYEATFILGKTDAFLLLYLLSYISLLTFVTVFSIRLGLQL